MSGFPSAAPPSARSGVTNVAAVCGRRPVRVLHVTQLRASPAALLQRSGERPAATRRPGEVCRGCFFNLALKNAKRG